ncbi:LysM peptidoglycan-binding domain-containing protein [Vreelandella subglaciescola]|jgi:murein DD-endopeptidase MepM/ murein hydrolase activator NlpD|uniref:LysM domain-containing protein n=1 Tax=Vreelandella subglaciescola TaxID=29571 RepID=A0A1M7EKI0_9GAMM|nr:LysM peptidoglycan-binding domain-containing protein [Halomonas subglaciescola]SHL92302.1 LysM domain-containing protein [Halomonas subglaciescola]
MLLLCLLAGCATDSTNATPAKTASSTSLGGHWVSIQRGDTLGVLAKRAGVPLVRLKRFNPGVRARKLEVGQRILVPTRRERAPSGGPYRYQIRPGDTYTGVARHFGARASRLQAANPGASPSALRVGQLIKVPLAGASSASKSPTRQATSSSTRTSPANTSALPSSAGSWPWPLDDYRVVRRYGKDDRDRLQPMLLAAQQGDEAQAVAPGEVSFADTMRQLGQVVIVHHDNNLQSVYALCDKVSVSTGQQVKAGDALCRIAQNEDSGRFVLLFDLRRNGKPIDPDRLLN